MKHVLLLAVFLLHWSVASAQVVAEEDSTETTSGGLLGAAAAASADSNRVEGSGSTGLDPAEVAAARAALANRSWYQKLAPKMGADVESNLTSIRLRGTLEASVFTALGTNGDVRYTATNTSYRQTDRDQKQRNLTSSIRDDLGAFGELEFSIGRNTNREENRLTSGELLVLDYAENDAKLGIEGRRDLGDDFEHIWILRGEIEDVQQTNRGVENNRSLAGAAITSVWRHERERWNVAGRYGADRRSGTRTVLSRDADANAARDTLGGKFVLSLGPKLDFDVLAQRASFIEERLDFARNASGAIDTAGTTQKVGNERESTMHRSIDVRLRARPLRRVSFNTRLGSSFSESEYAFSRQGVVQNGRQDLSTDIGFRYAAAGSLQVGYSYADNYNDRRITGSDQFRGRESRKAQSVEFSMKQRLFSVSDLNASVKQSLDQNIFNEVNNDNDRDRLLERGDLTIKSRVFEDISLDVGGTVSRTQDINIAASRVNNNKEERLIEVRGGYTWNPPSGLRVVQNYRLQIRYIDFVNSDDRDQFNKQGQLKTVVDYDLASGTDFSFEYVVDFRRTGQRDSSEPYREVYIGDQRRFDHRVRASIGVPYRGFRLDVGTERGYLREERGIRETNEDRGSVSFKLSGNRRFWANKVDLRLNVERVLQFGPRVREEQKDYWIARSGVTVSF